MKINHTTEYFIIIKQSLWLDMYRARVYVLQRVFAGLNCGSEIKTQKGLFLFIRIGVLAYMMS